MNCGISLNQDSLNQDLFPNMPITYPNIPANITTLTCFCAYKCCSIWEGWDVFGDVVVSLSDKWLSVGDFENIFHTTLFFESRCSSKKGIRRGEWFIVVEMKLQIWKLWKMTLRWNNRLQALKILYGEDEQVFTIQMFFSFFSHL